MNRDPFHDAFDRGNHHGPETPPPVIPAHELLRRIGRGSYGEVWLAKNMMGAFRAVKVVYRSSFENDRPFQRELSGIRKFEPISRSHDGFIDILQVGIDEAAGFFYYIMEPGDDLVTGQEIDPQRYIPKTLSSVLAQRKKLPVEECLPLGLALSNALSELHQHGLVHRDIKPSNIIFVHGIPKLVDIGLVAETHEARSYVGTEGFIPPEGPGSPQADIYSLGKLLYECSTGKDRNEYPELPTLLDRLPDREKFLELNEVILQACHHDLKKRYRTALDVQADLLIIVNGKSIKRLKLLEQRFARVKQAALLALIAVLALAGGGYVIFRERRLADEAVQRRIGASIVYGNRAMESGNYLGALPYFVDVLRADANNKEHETTDRLRIGSILEQCPKLTGFWQNKKEGMELAFDADGQRLYVAENFGHLKVYDINSGQMLFDQDVDGERLRCVTCSHDGKMIATGSEDGTVTLFAADTLKPFMTFAQSATIFCVRFSPDDRRIATACHDGGIRVWNLSEHRLEVTCHHAKVARCVNFSPDGRRLVSGGDDDTGRIWSVMTGEEIGPPLAHGSWVHSAAFSPDGQRVITAGFDHKARVWEVGPENRQIPPDLNQADGVRSVAFSPDGRYIMTACLDGAVRFWNARTFEPILANSMLKNSERTVYAVFDPDGRRVAISGSEGTIRLWDLAGAIGKADTIPWIPSADGGKLVQSGEKELRLRDALSEKTLSLHLDGKMTNWSFSPHGKFLITCSDLAPAKGGMLQIWETSSGRQLAQIAQPSNACTLLRMNADGRHFLTTHGKAAELGDITRPDQAVKLKTSNHVFAACFSPDGKYLATSADNRMFLWDAATGQALFPPFIFSRSLRCIEFSPDSSRLAGCCMDYSFTRCYAQMWDTRTGQKSGPPLAHADGVLCAAFSPDSTRIATSGEDFVANIWDATTGAQLTPPLQHSEQVHSAAFSPDGKWLATGSLDCTARVWNAETGDPLTPPLLHTRGVVKTVFLPKNRSLMTTDINGYEHLWPLTIEQKPVADLEAMVTLLADAQTGFGAANRPALRSGLAAWTSLRQKYPAMFSVSKEEIKRWHLAQLNEAESEKNTPARLFHLDRLLMLEPSNAKLLKRRNELR